LSIGKILEVTAVNIVELNDKWSFIKGENDIYSKREIESGEEVTLPHCFNAVDGQSGEGMFKGKCYYQRKISITKE